MREIERVVKRKIDRERNTGIERLGQIESKKDTLMKSAFF
jgi:hypothetical protein